MKVPFNDLSRVNVPLSREIAAAVDRVVRSGAYILGEEVDAFEGEFARFALSRFSVGVASGTDAITLSLWACGLRPGDAVVVPALTANPTVVAIDRAGGVPLFADVDPETYLMTAATVNVALREQCDQAGARMRSGGHPVRFLLPVHLYGAPCAMDALCELAAERGLTVIEDAAQAHGASWGGRPVGTWGKAGCFSFYPTKNLGALGDGGAVVTDDPGIVERLRLQRFYGQRNRVRQDALGLNSRLDEIQAAILRVKLPRVEAWNRERVRLADKYRAALPARYPVQALPEGGKPVHHLFVIRAPERASLRQGLAARGIETGVHYEVAANRHPIRAATSPACPVSERLAGEVVSLPLYPGMRADGQDEVIAALLE
ncbi:MAG: DegT/DnrJ/EryC1/StrS family aminotransferase [Planctomycetes bacterium]|nr:DegT/DnrJ/EryC1/StrS family aminotransferase [Planctomycetota bacterium]